MKHNYITKVVFHKLRKKEYDRKGAIATFHLSDEPNWQYLQHKALDLLWRITSLLSDCYHSRTYDQLTNGYMSEGNECFISPGCGHHCREIHVVHKYWNDETVSCFKKMIITLADLHQWDVVDETVEN